MEGFRKPSTVTGKPGSMVAMLRKWINAWVDDGEEDRICGKTNCFVLEISKPR